MRLRVLWRMISIDVMANLEYRGAFFLYMVNLAAAPVVSLLVWLAVRAHAPSMPMDRGQFVTYYIVLMVTLLFTSVWLGPFVAEQIRLGTLSPWLLRPAPYILNQVANNIGEKIVKVPLLLPLVFLIALAFRANLRLPTDPVRWLLFVLCVPLSAMVSFLLDFTAGSLAFWMHDVRGVLRVKYLAIAFLSGQFVPLALFPGPARAVLDIQPFRYTLSFPLEIITGSLSTPALVRGFAFQIGYVGLLYLLYRVEWRFGLRAYGASGA